MANRKLPQSYAWRGILCIALGLVLIAWPEFTAAYIVTIIGTVLFTVGVVMMISYNRTPEEAKTYGLRFPVAGLLYVATGVLLIAMPGTFAAILMVVMGMLLVLGAVDQVWMLVQASKAGITIALWRYIVPALILITGVVVTVSPVGLMKLMLMVFGAAAVLYGVIDLMDQALIRAGKK